MKSRGAGQVGAGGYNASNFQSAGNVLCLDMGAWCVCGRAMKPE